MSDQNDITPMEEDLLLSDENDAEPTNADIFRFIKKIDVNTAETKDIIAATTVRLTAIETKADNTDKRIDALEQQLAEIKSSVSHSSSTVASNIWAEQKKLRNNVSVIGLPPSNNEDLHQVVVDLCRHFDITIGRNDIETVYRVSNKRSNMIIV